MKRSISICAVAARQLVWKLLVIVLALAVCEVALFWRAAASDSFYLMLQRAKIPLLYWQAIAAVTIASCRQGADRQGKLTYTLSRLPDGEARITTLWAAVYAAAYVIVWAAQVGVLLLLWRRFLALNPQITAPKLALLVETYGGRNNSGWLHTLLPMDDWLRWLAVLLWYLSLSAAAAQHGFLQRRSRSAPLVWVLLFVGQPFAYLSIAQCVLEALMAVGCAIAIVGCRSSVWRCENEED